jgi:hypothetical protein
MHPQGSDDLQGRHSALIAALESYTTIPYNALLDSGKLLVLNAACVCPKTQDRRANHQ